ncbi:hypothetical protein pb186bvf_019210 [Paramecium bursaria]
MQIRDKYLDKQVFGEQNAQDNNQQLQKANEFFSRLPQVNLESEKVRCPKCNSLHKTYCLKCGELLVDKKYIPQIHLPVDLLVIHHEKEKHQKSSALPSQFLSNNVQIINYPFKTELQSNLYVLYPHQSARYVKDIPKEELMNIKQIVAIDCTWYQTNQIIENLDNPRFIKLQDYETYFWRYQHHSLKCLATIENMQNNQNYLLALMYYYSSTNTPLK